MAAKSAVTMHEMKLDKVSLERIDSGRKILELRLNDEKRKLVQPGDQITFKKFPTLDHSCVVEVVGLLHYADFATLIDDIDVTWLGYEEKDREWLRTSMYNIYTPEEEKETGVLGIRVRKLS